MTRATSLKVGAAQFQSEIGDIDANLKRHLDWIAEGRAAGLDLLVLPELSLTGHYGCDHLLELAMWRDDARLIRLAEAAGPMTLIVGFIEEGPGALFYNAAAVLKDGAVQHVHRKINLPCYGKLEEAKHYAQGDVVDIHALQDPWAAALLICADAWNPALTHLAFQQGATLLACPVSSGVEAVGADFDNPAGWALAMQFYAMIYGAPAIMVNRTGVEKDLTFWGGSRILGPSGEQLAVAGTEPELITARLDYDHVRQARTRLPTLRDSNLSLVQREIARLANRSSDPATPRRKG